MGKFSNPLDNIRVASPCPASGNEMIGDERKRYCSECKLNVYNLSDMTRREAESFIINAEGRVCIKFYRRSDGTVLTKDCPVGWQAVKRRVSRTAKALVSICAGLFGGIFISNQLQPGQNVKGKNSISVSPIDLTVSPNKVEDFESFPNSIPTLPTEEPTSDKYENYKGMVVGEMIPIEKINKKKINSKKIRRR